MNRPERINSSVSRASRNGGWVKGTTNTHTTSAATASAQSDQATPTPCTASKRGFPARQEATTRAPKSQTSHDMTAQESAVSAQYPSVASASVSRAPLMPRTTRRLPKERHHGHGICEEHHDEERRYGFGIKHHGHHTRHQGHAPEGDEGQQPKVGLDRLHRGEKPLDGHCVEPGQRRREPVQPKKRPVSSPKARALVPFLPARLKRSRGQGEQQEQRRQRRAQRHGQMPWLVQQVYAVVLASNTGREHEERPSKTALGLAAIALIARRLPSR